MVDSRGISGTWKALSLRRRVGIGVAVAVAAAVAVVAVVLLVDRDTPQEPGAGVAGPVAVPITPVALNESGFSTLARAVGQPIYWVGPRQGYLYELERASNRSVYVRYLPPGVDESAGEEAKLLVVATYPFRGALAALKRVAGGRGIRLPGGGLALVDERYPKSVHLAYPNVDYQVEVYDPSPARALEVASSGQVRPAG